MANLGCTNFRAGATMSKNPPFRSALLIDQHSRSAAEIMAFGYRRGSFGPNVGTPGAGVVVSGSLFVMPGDLILYVAVTAMTFDGQRLLGPWRHAGCSRRTATPHAAGADPVLDAAADLLAKQAPKYILIL